MRRFRIVFAAVAMPLLLAAVDPAAALHGRLVRVEQGRLAAASVPPDTKLIAFYFGASWCGPCRAFVPELRAAYPRLRAARVEVVFVSDDRDCRRMADYIRSSRMRWPAIGCRHRERYGWLSRDRGAALPGLLVYDRSGTLRSTSWAATGQSSPRQALARLLQQ